MAITPEKMGARRVFSNLSKALFTPWVITESDGTKVEALGTKVYDLVDIVADVCALYVAARTVADMSGVNCIQQPINNIQTDIQRIDSITSQRINANCFNKQDVIK